MSLIQVLDESTINQIAAGEVVERPSAVVKELIENAMDAGATAITAEIKEGGLSLIRITDNGAGIAKEDIPLAFLRHATSKIRSAEDLLSVTSLGFRGEALSSVAAVSQVELITKTSDSLNGYRYIIEGGEEKSLEEIGCPAGTTILVRNIFYNTPARRKFLKSATTEAGYVSDLMERLIVSHPDISFKFIVNNQVKLQSSGNNNSKDILYHVYGRDITKELIPVDFHSEELSISGFIGKPIINRGNRTYENYFINGRYIKSNVITKAIEEAYKPFLMQHKYPFTSLYFEIDPSLIDVNVHPQKMEVRLKTSEDIFQITSNLIRTSLSGKELIPKVSLHKSEEGRMKEKTLPEPFEENRWRQLEALQKLAPGPLSPTDNLPTKDTLTPKDTSFLKDTLPFNEALPSTNIKEKNLTSLRQSMEAFVQEESSYQTSKEPNSGKPIATDSRTGSIQNLNSAYNRHSDNHMNSNYTVNSAKKTDSKNEFLLAKVTDQPMGISSEAAGDKQDVVDTNKNTAQSEALKNGVTEQLNLFSQSEENENAPFLSKKALQEHRIIGQVFSTYWLIEYQKELYIIDQHAAHEKVLYERIMSAAKEKTYESQMLLPPIVLTLTLREQEVLQQYESVLSKLGYEFEPFGGNEFSVRAVPADLYGLSEKELILEFLDELADENAGATLNPVSVLEKTASLSCKAAVKANHTFSLQEAESLIKELLTLENPYHCPHGRPVIISMSQYELEKKFKRIL